MTTHACPSDSELSRMFEGDTEAPPPARLGGCDACRARWDRLAQAVRIARALPANIPSQSHREQIRVELLARAEASWRKPARIPVTKVALAAAAVVILAAGLAVLRMRATPHPLRSHVTIHGQLAAKYAIATAPPDETVRLHDGAITLDVEPLRPQERFRVLVGDDEVEVRGTSFEVIAVAERLVSVSVTRGHVDVRPRGRGTTSLGPGQSWVAEPIMAAPSPRPAPPPGPPPEPERSRVPRRRLARGESATLPDLPAARTRPALRQSPSEEAEFDDAWDAMRGGDFARAAVGFGDVMAVAPAGALADEAAFWRGVALARDGNPGRASAALKQMRAAYPQSPRWGEATVILGWLLVDAHQYDEATALFRAAEGDPSAAVRASAHKGLARSHDRAGMPGPAELP